MRRLLFLSAQIDAPETGEAYSMCEMCEFYDISAFRLRRSEHFAIMNEAWA